MHAPIGPESRRLLEKLIREILRTEAEAVAHPVREAKRLGNDVPPLRALREVSIHATAMRTRFLAVLHANEIRFHKGSLGATLATIRHLVVDCVVDGERAFRTALLDLRHGLDVVKLLREVARRLELFGVIRWCDDWLGARRTLVARVEAQLAWFVEQETLATGVPSSTAASVHAPIEEEGFDDDPEVLTSASDVEPLPSAPRSWHTDRSP